MVAGASFAESTECTVVELSKPVTPDPVESPENELAENMDEEDDEGENEFANSSTELKATGTVSTTQSVEKTKSDPPGYPKHAAGCPKCGKDKD